MTTENNIDYINEYIGLDEPDGTRSITKLVTIEEQNGYKDMTDKEISKLISYHSIQAKNSKSLELQQEAINKQLEIMIKEAEESAKNNKEFFNKIINTAPMFKTVTGNEVE